MMEAEYGRVQGKKKILKEHRKMGVHDLVHKKAKKIEGVKKAFKEKGYEAETISGNGIKRSTLVIKAQKRMKPEEGDRMEDIDAEPMSLKKKAIEVTEKLGFGRAEGMAMEKSVW